LEEKMKKYSEEEKSRWLEEWKHSGISAWSFAKEKGLHRQTFAKWVKNEKETKSSFVEIAADKKQYIQTAHEILIEKGDIKIHLPLSASKIELSTVIETLRAAL
jgi:transposase-like protein